MAAELKERRTRNAKHIDNGDGTITAIFEPNLHNQDGAEAWQNVDLAFRDDGRGGYISNRAHVQILGMVSYHGEARHENVPFDPCAAPDLRPS